MKYRELFHFLFFEKRYSILALCKKKLRPKFVPHQCRQFYTFWSLELCCTKQIQQYLQSQNNVYGKNIHHTITKHNIYNDSVVQKYFANSLISYIQFFFTVLCEKIQLVSKSVILLSIKCQVKEIKFFDIIGGMPLLAVTAAKKVLTIQPLY